LQELFRVRINKVGFQTRFKGFSLIEVLVAIVILLIIAVSLARLLTISAFSTRDDFVNTCLLHGASSAIEEARGNPSLVGSNINFPCGNLTVTVKLAKKSTYGNCTLIEAEATTNISSKKALLRDTICNWTQ